MVVCASRLRELSRYFFKIKPSIKPKFFLFSLKKPSIITTGLLTTVSLSSCKQEKELQVPIKDIFDNNTSSFTLLSEEADRFELLKLHYFEEREKIEKRYKEQIDSINSRYKTKKSNHPKELGTFGGKLSECEPGHLDPHLMHIDIHDDDTSSKRENMEIQSHEAIRDLEMEKIRKEWKEELEDLNKRFSQILENYFGSAGPASER